MLRIYNIKNKKEYIEEVAILTQNEWGKQTLTSEEYQDKINRKVQKNENFELLIKITNTCG